MAPEEGSSCLGSSHLVEGRHTQEVVAYRDVDWAVVHYRCCLEREGRARARVWGGKGQVR